MKLITDEKGLEKLTKGYFAWQKKIISIGDELIMRNEDIISRSRKLSEELIEVYIKFNDYFKAKKKYKEDFRDGVMDEIGDINNVAAITIAMINEGYRNNYFDGTLPLEIMFLRLIEHHPEYRTKPKTRYVIGERHTKEEQFKAWICELQHIVKLRDDKIKENEGLKRKKLLMKLNHLVLENNIRVMKDIDYYSKQDYEMTSDEIVPIYGIYASIGDLVNNSLILFGFLEEYTYFDLFKHMKEKLYNRDKRYNTGKK